MRDDTIEATSNPSLSAGMILMVGALMVEHGLSEFTMDADEWPEDKAPLLQLERNGHKLTMRIIKDAP